MAYLLGIVLAGVVTLSQVVTNPEDMGRLFLRAQRLLASGDFEGARLGYDRILAVPDRPLMKPSQVMVQVDEETLNLRDAARYQLANSHRWKARQMQKERELADPAVADSLDEKVRSSLSVAAQQFAALRDDPRFSLRERAAYLVAESWFEAGRHKEAADACDLLLQLFPASSFAGHALYTLGWARYRLEAYPEAIAAFSSYVEQGGGTIRSDRARLQIGLALEQEGHLEEALATFVSLAEDYNPASMNDRERTEMALRGLREGTSRRSVATKAWLKRGDLLARLGQPQAAVRAYRTVQEELRQEEFLAEQAWIRHGLLLEETEGPEAAAAVYRRAGEAQPRRGFQARMHAASMAALHEAQRYDESLAAHRVYLRIFEGQAIEAGISVEEARVRVAECLAELAQSAGVKDSAQVWRSEAVDQLQAVLDSETERGLHAQTLMMMGELQLALGDTTGAREAFEVLGGMEGELACRARLSLARVEPALADSVYAGLLERCSDPEVRSVAVLELGRRHRFAGRLEVALRLLASFEEDWPHAHLARFEMAQVMVEAGQLSQARELLEEQLEQLAAGPLRFEALAQLGLLYHLQGRHQAAIPVLGKAVEGLGGDLMPAARFGLGWSLLETGQAEEAWDVWRASLAPGAGAGGLGRLVRALGLCAHRLGDPERAKLLYQELLGSPATEAEGRLGMAQHWLDTGELARAEAELAHLIDAQGEQALRAALLKGRSLQAQGRVAEARRALERGGDLARETWLAAEFDFSLGAVAMQLGAFEEARGRLASARAAGSRPMQGSAMYYEAQCLLALEKNTEAMATLQRMSGSYPEHRMAPAAAFEVGELWFDTGRFDEAEAAYGRVVERWPDSEQAAEAMYGIGWCRLNLEDVTGMQSAFEALAERFPGSERARQGLLHVGDHHYNAEEWELAAGVYQVIVDRWGKSAEASTARTFLGYLAERDAESLYDVGMELFHEERYEEAAEVLGRVVTEHPGTSAEAAARCNLGAALERQELWREAVEVYAEALTALEGRPGAEPEADFAREGLRWVGRNVFGEEQL